MTEGSEWTLRSLGCPGKLQERLLYWSAASVSLRMAKASSREIDVLVEHHNEHSRRCLLTSMDAMCYILFLTICEILPGMGNLRLICSQVCGVGSREVGGKTTGEKILRKLDFLILSRSKPEAGSFKL